MNPRFLRFLPPAEQAKAIADEHLVALLDDVVRITESRLAGRHIDLDHKDVEAAYNLAWHGVCQRIAQGGKVENLTGLLVDITYKRSLDIYRQRHEAMHTDDGLSEEVLESRAASGDLAEDTDDRLKLTGLFERLKDRLNPNERKAAVLCILHGYSRAEAAKLCEISEPAFQKIIDSAWKKIASVAAYLEGRGCGDDEWARALRSFALGLIDEDHRDYSKLSEHIDTCASCRRYVQGLRGLSAVLPPLGVRFAPFAHHHVGLLHLVVKWVRRLLGGGHTGTAAAGGAGTSTTAGAGTVAGIGTVKAVAVVVGLAVAGVSIKVAAGAHHHRSHPSHPPPSRAAITAAPTSGLLSPMAQRSAVPITPHRQARGRTTHVVRPRAYRPPPREQAKAIREFGVEQAHTATATRPATPPPAPKVAAVPPPKPAAGGSREEASDFSFEQK